MSSPENPGRFTDSGLGIAVALRTPAPVAKWQIIHVALSALSDSLALRAWDHRTAFLPRSADDVSLDCEADYPAGESAWSKQFVALSVGGDVLYAPVGSALATGKAWLLTLQLLPDGRCGLAVDGRALRVSAVQVGTATPRHVIVDGQSVRTRILVDQLEIWRGVRQGIDWSKVDSGAVRH